MWLTGLWNGRKELRSTYCLRCPKLIEVKEIKAISTDPTPKTIKKTADMLDKKFKEIPTDD